MADTNPDFNGLGDFKITDNFMPSDDFLSSIQDDNEITPTPPKPAHKVEPEKEKVVTPDKPLPQAEKKEDKDILEILDDEDDTEDTTEEKEEDDSNPFVTIAQTLFEQGVFQRDEDENDVLIDSPEALLDRFTIEKKRGAQEIVDKFLDHKGEEAREYFEAIFVHGMDPRVFLERNIRIQDLSAIDLTQEGDQERVVRDYYKKMGRNKEFVDKTIDKLKNRGDLLDEAESVHPELIRMEQEALEQEASAAQKRTSDEKLRKDNYINSVNRIISDKLKDQQFDGIPVSKEFAGNIYNYLTAEKWKLPSGKLITDFDKEIAELNDPANYERKVKMAMLLQIEKEDPTLSKIQKKGVSKEKGRLFNNLARTQKTTKAVAEDTPSKWNL